MKKILCIMSLLMALFAGFTSCSSSDDDEKTVKVSTDKTTITFLSQKDVSETLNIVTNKEWTISGMPEWLNASSTSGRGNSTIRLTTKSANNTTSERSAELVIRSGNDVTTVSVTQETSLSANCNVKPINIVTLATGIAYDCSYGSNVAYFFRGYFTASEAERYTDDEIIAKLTEDRDNRFTPNDDYLFSISSMSPLTSYTLCTIAYDKNGNRGELVKTTVKTKSAKNQAVAEISDVKYNSTTWLWTTTPDGYTERYYQWFITNTSIANVSNAALAWYFTDQMKKSSQDDSNFAPIVKAQSWQRPRSGDVFHLMTWAKNVDGEFSGVIDRWMSDVSSKDNSKMKLVRFQTQKDVKCQTFRKSDLKEVK